MERVIVAFEGDKSAQRIIDILETNRVATCIRAHSGAEVRRLVARQRIGTVICGYKLREETAQDLFYDLPPATVMLVIARATMLQMLGDDIFSLSAPVSPGDLCASVKLLIQAGRRLERALRPQRSDEENETVHRAKQLLMERDGLSEQEAHRYIQKISMDSGSKLVDTAGKILDSRE